MRSLLFFRYIVQRVQNVLWKISTKTTKYEEDIPLKKLSKKTAAPGTSSIKTPYYSTKAQKMNTFSLFGTSDRSQQCQSNVETSIFEYSYSFKKKKTYKKFKVILPAWKNDRHFNTFGLKHSVCEPSTSTDFCSRSIMQQLEAHNYQPHTFQLFRCI
ncbi:hypothetical protein PNEG_00672 [Pneumocystis murina B123]|uniref:Uncharacterized protein n=1 Tax=Pneumocystis murina (strain B123) TaxID=1069680 RepID=M7NQS1_PNEMU|nr:hypothetical protein PNEG_00672 [Pneumocystis murina B123]EMR11073.1 hypothetical protein PNEG_00672 [Pneumocystis murina B123]